MNDMLKFRAWGIKEKAYLKLCSIHLSTKRVIVSIFGRAGGNISLPFSRVILEQSTGLKDKNGKEIYEGDIVVNTYYDDGEMYKVLWVDDSVAFGMESLDDMELYKLPLESLEVIGNIHENAELLEQEDAKG